MSVVEVRMGRPRRPEEPSRTLKNTPFLTAFNTLLHKVCSRRFTYAWNGCLLSKPRSSKRHATVNTTSNSTPSIQPLIPFSNHQQNLKRSSPAQSHQASRSMPTSNRFPPPAQGRNFQVIHLRNPIFTTNISESFDLLGIYPSLATAQRIATRALDHAVSEYQRRNYRGRYSSDIDLQLRGMITAFVADSQHEICLSEFHVNEVYLGDDAAARHERCWYAASAEVAVSGAQLVQQQQQQHHHHHSWLTARSAIQPLRFDRCALGRIVFAECCWAYENGPEWAHTRIPLFSRRCDGPFRTRDDTLYETMFAVGDNARS